MNESASIHRDSPAWLLFVRASFALSLLACALGIYFLPVESWVKGYMAMGLLFNVGASFTLAKTLRDDHEAKKLINRISEAKTEKILKEYDRDP